MLEKYIERRLNAVVKKHGGLCIKLNAFLYKGIPDRVIFTKDGRVKFVELKQPGKKLRPDQEAWSKRITEMNFPYEVIDSYEKADAQEAFLTAGK